MLLQITEEAERIKKCLGVNPGLEQRCVTIVAKKVLLDGPYFYNGKRINPVAKPIGAGVWVITHKEE